MAAYSVYFGSTDISDYVDGIGSIPLVDVDYAGQITLPSTSITVIANSVAYAKDGVISIYRNSSRFARFVIEEISENTEAGTKTLSLVDSLKLLERIYVKDLVEADYYNAMTASEDYDSSSRNKRFYHSLSSWPHKIKFVTLTHMVKTALVKAGIAAASAIDCNALYGELESGFIYYHNTLEEDVAIFMEELCFHPDQVRFAKFTTNGQPDWEGANMLEIVLYCLLVMNAQLRYVGDSVVLSLRDSGSAPTADAQYGYQKNDYVNTFDVFKTTIYYELTVGTSAPAGFGYYVIGSTGSAPVTEAWTAPASPPANRKISEKTFSLMAHCVVHRREVYETHYALDEMHGDAYALPTVNDYIFANQLVSILYNRYPTAGYVEQVVTDDNPSTLGARWLLKASLNIPEATMTLEY